MWQQSLLGDKMLQSLFRLTLGLLSALVSPFKEPHVAFLTSAFTAGEEIEICEGGGGGKMCEDIICRGIK